jgi:hypothetical protein
LQRRSDDLLNIVEMMLPGTGYACLTRAQKSIDKFRTRLNLGKTETELIALIDNLVYQSNGNWRTGKYDYFQYKSNGICYF